MSIVSLVMALSLGQVGPEPPTVVIQLPKGAVLTIERLQPMAPITPHPGGVFAPHGDVGQDPLLSASVMRLPANTSLTVRVHPHRPYAPVFRPGTPMVIALPGGGAVTVESIQMPAQPGYAQRPAAAPYAVVLYEASRLILEVPPEQYSPPPPSAVYTSPAPLFMPYRFRY